MGRLANSAARALALVGLAWSLGCGNAATVDSKDVGAEASTAVDSAVDTALALDAVGELTDAVDAAVQASAADAADGTDAPGDSEVPADIDGDAAGAGTAETDGAGDGDGTADGDGTVEADGAVDSDGAADVDGIADSDGTADVDGASDLDGASDTGGTADTDTAGTADLDVAPTADIDTAAVDAPCTATAELCDGLDNDCDGETDENFALWWPQTKPIPVGSPCKGPNCGGTVVCHSPVQSICSGCPPGIDLTVQLAPASAKLSPLVATGGFTEVTAQIPLSLLQLESGGPMKIPVGSSAVAVDADGDGDLDLVWIDGKENVVLMTRSGPWQYSAQLIWPGKGDAPNNLTAITATDPDRDGIPEIIVGGSALLRLVRQSSGVYVNKASEVQLKMPSGQFEVQHLLAADLDGDGSQDLLAGLFHCGSPGNGLRAWLWREGGGYLEASQTLGLKHKGSPWTCMHSDVDGDGRLDVIVLTESCEPMGGVTIFKQQPPGIFGSPYQQMALPPLFTVNGNQAGSPMGGSQADINGDGILDYYFSEIALQNFEAMGGKLDPLDLNDPVLTIQNSNYLYISQPKGNLLLGGLQAGLWAPLSISKQPMVGWAALWDDLDRDGHLDLVTTNGYEFGSWVLADAGGMRPLIWRNNGKQQFTDISALWGMPAIHASRNMVLTDLDGDGDSDLVFGGQGVAARVYRNDLVAAGSDLRVRLKGTVSDPWGLGSRLVLQTNQRTIYAEMSVQAVSQGMGVPEVHFSLRSGEVAASLKVTWPSGWVSDVATGLAGPALWVTEPLLFELSARWSPGGIKPVEVTVYNLDSSGKPAAGLANCSIDLLPSSQGAWLSETKCGIGSCTRTWEAGGLFAGGVDRIALQCGPAPIKTRPAIFY